MMTTPSICVLDGYTVNPGDNPWDPVDALGDVTVYDKTDVGDIVDRAKDAEILVTNKTPLSAETLAQLPNAKFICVLATGFDVVDAAYAGEKGIPVSNVPAYSTQSVAQFTIALILDRCHRVGHHANAVAEGRWQHCDHFCFWDISQMELAGKTLGIVGYGSIGRDVSRLAAAFGMTILVHTRTPKDPEPGVSIEWVGLDELMARSDIVSLHCPLTAKTEGMIDSAMLGKMKRSAILINTGRGALVDEEALAEALNSGTIAGAACDVVSQEPITEDNPLLSARNVTITPHMAWGSLEARQRLMVTTAANIKAFLEGEPINVVNG